MPWKNGDPRHRIVGGKHRAETRFALIQSRLRADSTKNKHYAGKQCTFTKDEFTAWFMPRDFEGSSVDRIDPAGDYTLDNLQVIPLAENIRKDKVIAKDGLCRCYSCGNEKDLESFAKDKRRANGHSTCCKQCDNQRKRI